MKYFTILQTPFYKNESVKVNNELLKELFHIDLMFDKDSLPCMPCRLSVNSCDSAQNASCNSNNA